MTSASLDPKEVAALVRDGAVVVDVRTLSEFNAGHMPGSHLLVADHATIEAPALIGDRAAIVVCASGNRSSAVAAKLAAMGLRAWWLAGGLGGWLRSGRVVVNASGRKGDII